MKAANTLILTLVFSLLLIPQVFAGTDEYMGDTNIYAGVPTTLTRPNVLIIIDNSRATLHTAAGYAYEPWMRDTDGNVIIPKEEVIYPQKAGCTYNTATGEPAWSLDPDDPAFTWDEDPRNGCYLPWNIYVQDNQGDFATTLLDNSTNELENLSCNLEADGTNQVLSIFQNYGSYSGSGIDPYPNINGDGTCDWTSNNSSGVVYALGNYLNYTQNAEGDDRIGAPDPGDGVVIEDPDDPCADLPPPDVVSVTLCPENKYFNSGECKKPVTNYFQVTIDHTSDGVIDDVTGADSTGNTPLNDDSANYPYGTEGDENYVEDYPWLYLGTTAPDGVTADPWATSTVYNAFICEDDGGEPIVSGASQRELIYNSLEKVVGAAAGVVNFGAMTYGSNNSGAVKLYDIADLSYNTALLNDANGIPQCPEGSTLPVCEFLAAIPGPGETDGPQVLSSNTLRPQAESVYDAGYYYGADYDYITNTERIPEPMENICDLNHIILLTNGFSNGDGSPKLDQNIGDYDGDGYDNEEVYGLGSHYLDDVAKYLKVNYDIKTHTVLAFQSADDLVMNAASDGDGEFYNVFNANELSAALLDLLSKIINDASTSFVAPVVPASTTNRTISSNKVYLGLFRPQESGPWHGNVKKYGLDLENARLTEPDHTAASPAFATDPYGNFYDYSISYWSETQTGLIPTSINDTGYIHTGTDDENDPMGDGGEVSAGGIGGVLLEKMRGVASAIRTDGSDWYPASANWRNIFTDFNSSEDLWHSDNQFLPSNTNLNSAVLGGYSDPANLIRFVHGFVDDDDTTFTMTPATAEVRDWVMGDVLHSRPLVFNYSKYTTSVDNTCGSANFSIPNSSYDPGNMGDPSNTTAAHNSSIIYVGANDGMLHAFRDCDGEEIWSFMPKDALSSIQYYKDPAAGHPTFVDTAPSLLVLDENQDGYIDQNTDHVVLVFGQRRGGGTNTLDETGSRGSYYAMDVTNPYAPELLWSLDNSALGELGETWSQPRLAKVKVDDNNFKVVAFIGAGYDNNEDLRFGETLNFPDASDDGTGNPIDINEASSGGTVDGSGSPQVSDDDYASVVSADSRYAPRGRGLAAIEVASFTRSSPADLHYTPTVSGGTVGQVYWSYTPASYNGDEPVYSFASDLNVLDIDGNSVFDTIYIGDTGGNLWRFDLDDVDPNNWTGTILFESNPGGDGSDSSDTGRKIFYKPVIATVGAPHIYFGTGDREHPLNVSVEDRMYCLIDWGAITTLPTGTYPVHESDLEDVTLNLIQKTDTSVEDAAEMEKRLYSTPSSSFNPFGADIDHTFGWYIRLDGTDRDASGDPGEKVLAPPTVFGGRAYFSTYQLIIGPASGCDGGNLGISRLYEVDYKTGEAVENYDTSNDLTIEEISGVTNDRAIGGEDGEILQRTDRVRVLGEGIPSGIVTIIDAAGRVTQLVSSSDKVEAENVTDTKLISPVYWMQW